MMGDKEVQTLSYEEAWKEVLTSMKEEVHKEVEKVFAEYKMAVQKDQAEEHKKVNESINKLDVANSAIKDDLEKTKTQLKTYQLQLMEL